MRCYVERSLISSTYEKISLSENPESNTDSSKQQRDNKNRIYQNTQCTDDNNEGVYQALNSKQSSEGAASNYANVNVDTDIHVYAYATLGMAVKAN